MTIYLQSQSEAIRQLSENLMITYEQPLNEKIRLFLRLELLMERFRYHIAHSTQQDTIAAVHLLLDLYNLSARLDIKSEILKEIDRIAQSARLMAREEGADLEKMDKILESLNHHSDILYRQRGQVGQHLRNHMFFNSLRQRASLPGGINGFDIPLFHYWQEQDPVARVTDLEEWISPYVAADAAARNLLNIIREQGEQHEVVCKDGFYQSVLESRKPYQMLRIQLPRDADYYPEISAGKQRFTLRLVKADALADRGKQIRGDVGFNLILCNF